MSKRLPLKLGDKTIVLNFNMVFGEQIFKRLNVEDPTPENIMRGVLELNSKSAFLMYKALIYCGMLGEDYENGYEESYSEKEVAQMIAGLNTAQLEEVFNTFSQELGFDFTAKAEKAEEETSDKKKE